MAVGQYLGADVTNGEWLVRILKGGAVEAKKHGYTWWLNPTNRKWVITLVCLVY